MLHSARIGVAALALLLSLMVPALLAAAEPELLSAKPFTVSYANGAVDVNFTLALSQISTYPVTITAISGSVEETLYSGRLSEGVYRFRAPLAKIKGPGDLRVILRTQVTNRTGKGNQSFGVYLKWEGKM